MARPNLVRSGDLDPRRVTYRGETYWKVAVVSLYASRSERRRALRQAIGERDKTSIIVEMQSPDVESQGRFVLYNRSGLLRS